MLLAGLLAGCEPPTPDPQQVVITNAFEQAPADVAAGIFNAEQAHSLPQSIKVGQDAEFAPLGSGTWANLHQPHHLRLRLWSWLPTARRRTATVVVEAQRASIIPGEAPYVLARYYFNLCEVVRRYQQWAPSTFFVSLPRGLRPTDNLNFYMWVPSNQGGAVYVDDFCVENLD